MNTPSTRTIHSNSVFASDYKSHSFTPKTLKQRRIPGPCRANSHSVPEFLFSLNTIEITAKRGIRTAHKTLYEIRWGGRLPPSASPLPACNAVALSARSLERCNPALRQKGANGHPRKSAIKSQYAVFLHLHERELAIGAIWLDWNEGARILDRLFENDNRKRHCSECVARMICVLC